MKGNFKNKLAVIGSIVVVSFLIIIGFRHKAIHEHGLEGVIAED